MKWKPGGVRRKQACNRAGAGERERVEGRMSEPIYNVTTTNRAPILAEFLCPQCKQRAITPHRCDKDGPGVYVVAFLRDPVERPPIVFDDESEEAK